MKQRYTLYTLAVLLLLLASAAGSLLGPRHASAEEGRPSGTPAVSSADSARALDQLKQDLARLVTLEKEIAAGHVGIEVRSITRNRRVFDINAAGPLTPASTTKVVTAFAALSELGADHMVRTIVGLTNRPTREGVLVGNVYVRGHGDPFLEASDIDALVDQFMATGIKRIEGNVIGDGSYFDEKTKRTEYSGDDDPVMTLPPITALTIDNSVFTVLVSAPSKPGLPLNVQTVPRSTAFQVVNQAVSSGGAARKAPARKARKSRRRSSLEDQLYHRFNLAGPEQVRFGDEPAVEDLLADADQRTSRRKPKVTRSTARSKKAAAASRRTTRSKRAATSTASKASQAGVGARGLRVQVAALPDGRQTITVTGTLPVNRRASYRYQMSRPAVVVAGMIHERLASRGITITGGAVAGTAPTRIKVMAQVQRPLTEIMNLVMKNSNNFLAEMVFKMIGADAGAERETALASLNRIAKRMDAAGVNFEQCVINDGSGLSRANVLTAESLTDMLVAAHRNRAMFEPFYSSLSVAGVDGTLRKRLKGTAAEGNLHGKTGTLRNVSALAGYVTSRDGEIFAFTTLMNGTNHGAYRAVQDRIAKRLAEFTYTAPAR